MDFITWRSEKHVFLSSARGYSLSSTKGLTQSGVIVSSWPSRIRHRIFQFVLCWQAFPAIASLQRQLCRAGSRDAASMKLMETTASLDAV